MKNKTIRKLFLGIENALYKSIQKKAIKVEEKLIETFDESLKD